MTQIRLQKIIADSGYTSRRKAEVLIQQGKVTVDGQVITQLGTKVDPNKSAIQVEGSTIDPNMVSKLYLVINKPRGYISSLNDPEGRDTVVDLIKEIPERVFPVGRLDYLSEGLLILTNDGELANIVMHPRHEVEKVYHVKVFGVMNSYIMKKLKVGVEDKGEFLKPESVRVIEQLPTKTWLEFRLKEGKNREIRRICESVGLSIDKLKRVAIENLTIEGIAPGKYMFFSKAQLLKKLGLKTDGSKIDGFKSSFISQKRTVNSKKLRKLGRYNDFNAADDDVFKQYRKDHYYSTIERKKKLQVEHLEKEKNTRDYDQLSKETILEF